MSKRRIVSILAAVLLAAGVSGCADGISGIQDQLHEWNPMGSGKKRLTGDRRAMFPEGVPGVQQGVPPQLMKGAAQEEPVAVPVAVTPEPKPARSRRVRTAKPAQAPRTARARRAPAEEPGAAGAGWTEPPQRQAPAAAPARQAAPAQGGWGAPPSAPATAWPDPPKTQ